MLTRAATLSKTATTFARITSSANNTHTHLTHHARYLANAANNATNNNNNNNTPKTLYDKIFDEHLVATSDAGQPLIYIDRHLVHEVTSPQAFEGLTNAKRPVRRPDCTLVTVDHNVPTTARTNFKDIASFIVEEQSREQVLALERNVQEFNLAYFGMGDRRQGIVHIIGPEQGFTVPGSTCVCGDSHTATHGAFGALAFGIGTSEVEHVLATSTLPQAKAKNMLVRIDGTLGPGVTAKDVVLHVCGAIGTAGGTGSTIEFAGEVIRAMSMEGRMSVCNMAIEAGARAGLCAPDAVTLDYLEGRPMLPKPDSAEWAAACRHWLSLASDDGAHYDKEVHIDAADIAPTVTWGTSPEHTAPITGRVPVLADITDPQKRAAAERALAYMGLDGKQGELLATVSVDKVFIGSCTNGRIEDIRDVAAVAKGRTVKPHVHAMVVPGSGLVKEQAEEEGLDVVLTDAGFEWRQPGCSMCLAMNADKLGNGERCASTSNRNFEGRQGAGGRTHLVSPLMAAAAAVEGTLADVRKLDLWRPAAATTAAATPGQKTLYEESHGSAGAVIREAEAGGGAGAGAAGMEPVSEIRGQAAPLDMSNVDTDMIIPKEFLKTIKRTGLGFAAFAELRYENPVEVAKKGGSANAVEKESFVLNQSAYRAAPILVAGENFGCGSSREHAPWSLFDFGIRAIIAPSFADIFYNNCFKNGLLPVALPKAAVDELMADAREQKKIVVDLATQTVKRTACGTSYDFEVDSFRKHCLMNGFDDISLTLQKMDEIRAFEAQRSQNFPWLDGATTRVPKLFEMRGMPKVQLDTPSPEDWRREVRERRKAAAAAA